MPIIATRDMKLEKRAYITEDTNNTNIGFFNFVTFQLLYAVVSLMIFIDVLSLLLRIASIRERRARLQSDDYCAILACAFATAAGSVVLYGAVNRVTGRHDWDPWPPPEGPWPRSDYTIASKDTDHPVFIPLYINHIKVNYILNTLQSFGHGVAQLSFLFLFRKLFSRQKRWYTSLINGLIGFVILYMLAHSAIAVFVCGVHPEAQWTNHEDSREKCFQTAVYVVAFDLVSLVTDTAVFVLPLYPLRQVTQTMSRRKRNYILIVFCLGFLAVISSVFEVAYTLPIILYPDNGFYAWLRDHGAGDGDTFGWSAGTVFWAYMQLAIGAAVCNLPVVSRFIVRRWLEVSKQATRRTLNQVMNVRSRKLQCGPGDSLGIELGDGPSAGSGGMEGGRVSDERVLKEASTTFQKPLETAGRQ